MNNRHIVFITVFATSWRSKTTQKNQKRNKTTSTWSHKARDLGARLTIAAVEDLSKVFVFLTTSELNVSQGGQRNTRRTLIYVVGPNTAAW